MSRKDLHVVLVAPEVPWNCGNVGRSCLAADAQLHLVEPIGFHLDEKGVRRAGLDYWSSVLPRVWPDFERLSDQLPPPLLITPEAEAPLWDWDLRGPVSLVFGRESEGLPKVLRRRHRRASLPMPGQAVRSLNVSTTVGIALWEALRQRTSRASSFGPGL
ncbi:MAG: TrmH family RNA methyltransferase [Myxococcota bacterium]